MPKYYVWCGDLFCTVEEQDAKEAAVKALGVCTSGEEEALELDHMFNVNEVGFISPPDVSFPTDRIIIDAGWELE